MTVSEDKKTIGEIFSIAIENECKVADFYTALKKLFVNILEISAFWAGMAEDEKLHMKTLQGIYNSLNQEQLISPSEEHLFKSVIAIRDFLSKNLINSVKNLDDAYEIAHQIESSEVNAILKFLLNHFISSKKQTKFTSDTITTHQKKIMDFGKNFGGKTWRKQIDVQH